MKFLKKCVFFLMLLLFFLLVFSCNVFASSVPDEVITKAREVNLGHTDNVIILQDTATSDYYIPYCEGCSSNSNSWRYSTYKSVNCFICPSWHVLNCIKYSNGSFSDVGSRSMNTIGSNSVIQESFNSISLIPVFADNNIVYYNVEGHTNGDIFFQNPVQEVVVIPVLEGVEELPKAVTTTLKMILPVGLVVFGILLLVYIIRLLILRVT